MAWLSGFLVALALSASAILVGEALSAQRSAGYAEPFHRLVGGLGFGPAIDLSDCILAFDPRLDDGCAFERGPVPGGVCFCPRHGGTTVRGGSQQ